MLCFELLWYSMTWCSWLSFAMPGYASPSLASLWLRFTCCARLCLALLCLAMPGFASLWTAMLRLAICFADVAPDFTKIVVRTNQAIPDIKQIVVRTISVLFFSSRNRAYRYFLEPACCASAVCSRKIATLIPIANCSRKCMVEVPLWGGAQPGPKREKLHKEYKRKPSRQIHRLFLKKYWCQTLQK